MGGLNGCIGGLKAKWPGKMKGLEKKYEKASSKVKHISSRTKYFSLINIAILGIGSSICVDSVGSLQTELMSSLKLSDGEYSLMYSVNSWSHIALALTGSFIIDSVLGIKMGAMISSFMVSAGHFIFALGILQRAFWSSIVGRFFFGLGAEFTQVCLVHYSTKNFQGKELKVIIYVLTSMGRLSSSAMFQIASPLLTSVRVRLKCKEDLGVTLLVVGMFTFLSIISAGILSFIMPKKKKPPVQTPGEFGKQLILKRIEKRDKQSVKEPLLLESKQKIDSTQNQQIETKFKDVKSTSIVKKGYFAKKLGVISSTKSKILSGSAESKISQNVQKSVYKDNLGTQEISSTKITGKKVITVTKTEVRSSVGVTTSTTLTSSSHLKESKFPNENIEEKSFSDMEGIYSVVKKVDKKNKNEFNAENVMRKRSIYENDQIDIKKEESIYETKLDLEESKQKQDVSLVIEKDNVSKGYVEGTTPVKRHKRNQSLHITDSKAQVNFESTEIDKTFSKVKDLDVKKKIDKIFDKVDKNSCFKRFKFIEKIKDKFIKKKSSKGGRVKSDKPKKPGVNLSYVKRFPPQYWYIVLINLTFNCLIFTLLPFSQRFLVVTHGMSIAGANGVTSFFSLLACLLAPCCSLLIEYTGREMMWVKSGLIIGLMAYLLLTLTRFTPIVSLIVLSLAYSLLIGSIRPMFALVIPENELPTALSLSTAIQHCFFAINVIMAGKIAEWLGYSAYAVFIASFVIVGLTGSTSLMIHDKRGDGILFMSRKQRQSLLIKQKMYEGETDALMDDEQLKEEEISYKYEQEKEISNDVHISIPNVQELPLQWTFTEEQKESVPEDKVTIVQIEDLPKEDIISIPESDSSIPRSIRDYQEDADGYVDMTSRSLPSDEKVDSVSESMSQTISIDDLPWLASDEEKKREDETVLEEIKGETENEGGESSFGEEIVMEKELLEESSDDETLLEEIKGETENEVEVSSFGEEIIKEEEDLLEEVASSDENEDEKERYRIVSTSVIPKLPWQQREYKPEELDDCLYDVWENEPEDLEEMIEANQDIVPVSFLLPHRQSVDVLSPTKAEELPLLEDSDDRRQSL